MNIITSQLQPVTTFSTAIALDSVSDATCCFDIARSRSSVTNNGGVSSASPPLVLFRITFVWWRPLPPLPEYSNSIYP